MRRLLPILAAMAGLALPAPAVAQRDAHEHRGELFRLQFEPVMNSQFIYRAYLADPDDFASLTIERDDDYPLSRRLIDLTPATCPALRPIVERLATLPLPTVALGEARPYNPWTPRPALYYFSGFVHFPNGAEGEMSFYASEEPGERGDPLFLWAQGLVQAFDACRPRAGQARTPPVR